MTSLRIEVAKNTLVVPIGPAGCGKSTLLFAVAEANLDSGWRYGNDDVRAALGLYVYTKDVSAAIAQAALDMVRARLVAGLGAALDSTHNGHRARLNAVALARREKAPVIALLSKVPLSVVLARNAARHPNKRVPEDIIQQMYSNLEGVTVATLTEEGFDQVYVFDETTERLDMSFN